MRCSRHAFLGYVAAIVVAPHDVAYATEDISDDFERRLLKARRENNHLVALRTTERYIEYRRRTYPQSNTEQGYNEMLRLESVRDLFAVGDRRAAAAILSAAANKAERGLRFPCRPRPNDFLAASTWYTESPEAHYGTPPGWFIEVADALKLAAFRERAHALGLLLRIKSSVRSIGPGNFIKGCDLPIAAVLLSSGRVNEAFDVLLDMLNGSDGNLERNPDVFQFGAAFTLCALNKRGV